MRLNDALQQPKSHQSLDLCGIEQIGQAEMLKTTILIVVLAATALGSIMERRVPDMPCGSYTLTNRTRIIIQSPNFPQQYMPNYSCQWEISCPAAEDHYLHFKCPHFTLQSSIGCINDRLTIDSNGETTTRCGTDNPNGTTTSTGWARLSFFSDAFIVAQGFRCYIWCHAYRQPAEATTLSP
ncbi:CUB domain [Trinorchestia longiramus]|nr:CUB domain [Trinorchestia longiramus]